MDPSPGRGGREARRPSLLTADLVLILVIGTLGVTALNLTLPILPLVVARVTGATGAIGTVTAAGSAATILLELGAPGLLRRYPDRSLLIAALAVQALAMLGFALAHTLVAMLLLGALSGAGFGTVVTVTANAVRARAPAGRLGEAIGYYGLSASVPTIFAPPLALLLLHGFGAAPVFLVGAASCAGGALLTLGLRPTPPRRAPEEPRHGVLATLAMPAVTLVWLSFVLTSVTYGAAVSFTPLLLGTAGIGSASVFLFAFGLARTVSRVLAGSVIDRVGEARIVLPGLAVGAAGLALLPLRTPALTIIGGLLFGAAFGVVQTGAFVAMLQGAGAARGANVSGIWNMAVDLGFGGGTLLLAPVAAGIGFERMFWLLPALFAAAFALRVASHPRPG